MTFSCTPLSLAEVHRRRAALRVDWSEPMPTTEPDRLEVEVDEPEVLR